MGVQVSKKRTIVGEFVDSKWTSINTRVANGKYKNDSKKNICYNNVFVKFTRSEFRDWCWTQELLIKSLKRPSIDRIDSNKDYSIDNIRIIELRDNIILAKSTFTDTHGTCYKCKNNKLIDEFATDKRRSNGKSNICKICDSSRSKGKYIKLKNIKNK